MTSAAVNRVFERRPNGERLTAIFAEVVVFNSKEAADLDFGRCDR